MYTYVCILRRATHEEDGGVVVHVEEAELAPLAAHDNEERVAEVEDLGQVEDPQHLVHYDR